ncbi:NAD(P)H-binding protein [Streptomyces sp. NPDC101455]|uniref:NmrA family NAD(P)-binding protein n=1 Tax=Streptomyces sp. NPDC101455 TaxID=3366142 RepID=UPI003813356D
MSSLLVLGGSGRTGAHVLEHAVRHGHRVRALVRHPDKVQAPAGVELIRGTPALRSRPFSARSRASSSSRLSALCSPWL